MYGSYPISSISYSADKPSSTAVTATVGRPSADVSAGGWLPSTGTALYGVINEVVPDPAYIYTSTLTTCEVALNATASPGNRLNYKASSSMGNSITVALLAGGTQVATWSHALTTTDDLYSHILTAAQQSMMNGGNLTVQITAF